MSINKQAFFCPICNEEVTDRVWKHYENNHKDNPEFSEEDYIWEITGRPICKNCGGKIIRKSFTRRYEFCCRSCVNHYSSIHGQRYERSVATRQSRGTLYKKGPESLIGIMTHRYGHFSSDTITCYIYKLESNSGHVTTKIGITHDVTRRLEYLRINGLDVICGFRIDCTVINACGLEYYLHNSGLIKDDWVGNNLKRKGIGYSEFYDESEFELAFYKAIEWLCNNKCTKWKVKDTWGVNTLLNVGIGELPRWTNLDLQVM